ncbi:hypothetical protein KDK95_18115 [Actinospica sp. MGRD01-02]|uniref:Membrane-anchored protein n=1 Tax=Actinospica acidithermotolerans TaxID=2828514 RepID=A0A941ED66_9ACTN|nr:hypothetical protein [Actinospica acidithermotolerans]MBR7828235.1 hypothetical protein [Actinospica acidithermotolerans]
MERDGWWQAEPSGPLRANRDSFEPDVRDASEIVWLPELDYDLAGCAGARGTGSANAPAIKEPAARPPIHRARRGEVERSPRREARSAGGSPPGDTGRGALRVPEVALAFWSVKALSTAMGESTSDALVNSSLGAQVAVVVGFLAFLAALAFQFRQGHYRAWPYWLSVCGVGVFGTMVADVMHVALRVPYTASSIFYAFVLAAVFIAWRRTEHTLDIHSIDTSRREAFYWAAVVATFAMGTAVGDFTAVTLRLGYWSSAAMFAGLILIPLVGWRVLRWNPVACFWSAYVLTRPLGASIADGLAKPKNISGMNFGDAPVAGVLAALIIVLVTYLATTKKDVQR